MAAFKFSDKTKAIVGAVVPFVSIVVSHYAGLGSDEVFLVGAGTAVLTGLGVYKATNAPA